MGTQSACDVAAADGYRIAARLFGYFPGRRLRKVGDLPRGVMRQWRRWCLDPEYAIGAEGERLREAYAALTIPISGLSFTDDEFMSERSIAALHESYANAAKFLVRISPSHAGVERIGHFGFYRPRFASTLWARFLLPELRDGPMAGR